MPSIQKKAVTLSELLVVIAIIAILAAILFPVFAQAKTAAKKTVDLSNVKQIALGTVIYSSDYDDNFPAAFGKDCSGQWDADSRIAVPWDWNTQAVADYNAFVAGGSISGSGACKRVNGGINAAPNSINPYIKSWDMFTMPGAPKQSGFATSNPAVDKAPANVSYNFNGLVSSYSQTAVNSPSTTATWWPAFGQVARIGDTYAEPFLICPDGNSPCVFNGGGLVINDTVKCHNDSVSSATVQPGNTNGTQSGMGNIHLTSFCFGKVQNWAFADGHAKARPMGTGDQKLDPWPINGYLNGVPDSAPGYEGHEAVFDQYCHVPLFRPDIAH